MLNYKLGYGSHKNSTVKLIKIGFGLFLFWIGVLFFGALIANSRDPIRIASFGPVITASDSRVTTEGYWQPSKDDSSDILEISKIECYKEIQKCVIATAGTRIEFNSLKPIYLHAPDVEIYDIHEWTKSRLVFGQDWPCADKFYSIDLVTKSASGVSRPKNQSTNVCTGLRNEITYTLIGVFEKSLELSKKANPWFFELAVAPLVAFSRLF